jgi:hypothetical protein
MPSGRKKLEDAERQEEALNAEFKADLENPESLQAITNDAIEMLRQHKEPRMKRVAMLIEALR